MTFKSKYNKHCAYIILNFRVIKLVIRIAVVELFIPKLVFCVPHTS